MMLGGGFCFLLMLANFKIAFYTAPYSLQKEKKEGSLEA